MWFSFSDLYILWHGPVFYGDKEAMYVYQVEGNRSIRWLLNKLHSTAKSKDSQYQTLILELPNQGSKTWLKTAEMIPIVLMILMNKQQLNLYSLAFLIRLRYHSPAKSEKSKEVITYMHTRL